jgi:voltage-gated potassium channel
MLVAVFGIASLFYIFTTVMETLVLSQLYNIRGKRKMLNRMSNMENHFILVGFGRVGRIVAKDLESRGHEYIVVDSDFEQYKTEMVDRPDFYGLEGDATDDAILQKASINKARAIIVTIGNPAVSTFVVLSARGMNPNLYIIARGDSEILDSKLYKAGANKVINPYESGGKQLANYAVNPNISDFMETNFNAGDKKLRLERFKLPDNCSLVGHTLLELDVRKHTGVTIIAVIKNESAELNPPADYTVADEDEFVALGTPEQIDALYAFVDKAREN